MLDISIDLETGGQQANSTIYSIGAVVFDRATEELGNSMHIALTTDQNRHFDSDTLEWWTHPDRTAAFIALTKLQSTNLYRFDRGLEKLAKFIGSYSSSRIWSNGASFDIGILTDAYRQLDMPLPWKFRSERDTRTIVDACLYITGIDPREQVKTRTEHTALDDAIHQAKYTAKAFNLISQHVRS